ncbi:MAG: DUF3185 family protein [Fibrobacter sp.]|nr:DUF3185 family protein [Fibrobacter sp.]
MNLIRIISIALITCGIILTIFGIDAWNSVGSDVSRAFEGGPSNRAIWLLVSGITSFVLGVGGLFYSPKARTQ